MKSTSPSCRSVSRHGQVTGPGQHRPRGDAQPGAHLPGDDAGQRRLAQARGAGEEDVVDRLMPLAGRLQHDAEVLDQLGLPDELRQRARSEAYLLELLVGIRTLSDRTTRASSDPAPSVFGLPPRDGQDLATGPRAHRLASARTESKHLFHADIVA